MITYESILDFPQNALNPKLWVQLDDGSYELRDDARQTIQNIVDWAQNAFRIPQMNVNITGSNASNSYSDDSDIDIHFNSPKFKKDKADEFNTLLHNYFDKLVVAHPELSTVNGVRSEVYMQPNPYQDLMSVGCYDFLNRKWLSGPEIKDVDFDPYAEYFNKDMKNVDDVIDDVRSTILKIYELAIAFIKTNDQEFKEKLANKLKPLVSKAASLYKSLRNKRKHNSSPEDAEEALANREDDAWKLADSTFKLLDKFGYLGILKACAQNIDRFEEDTSDIQMAMKEIVSIIGQKISTKAIDDSEEVFIGKLLEFDKLDESFKQMISIGALAALMSIGSFMPATVLAKELSIAKQQAAAEGSSFTKDSPHVKQAIANSAKDNQMVGSMSKTNVVNAIAQVLWKEARGEGDEGLNAIASVIWNRSNGDPQYFVDVMKEKKQFSCLNDYNGGWTDATYKWFFPAKSVMNDQQARAIWMKCNDIALKLVNKDFASTIGNCNSYLNKKTASKKAVNTWGKSCNMQIKSHSFGYLREHDPKYVIPGTMTPRKTANKATISKAPTIVVVKNGDTLGKIAKANKTTIDKVLKLNPSIKDPSKIQVGQKLKVK